MERVISQIGDSTDGEDYENDQGNRTEIAQLQSYLASTYSVSAMLKYMGELILRAPEVRKKYKKLKSKFISVDDIVLHKYSLPTQTVKNAKIFENTLKDYDKKLGRGWGLLISQYDPSSRGSEIILSNYYKLHKTIIDSKRIPRHDNNAEKAKSYLKSIQYEQIRPLVYKINKVIEKYAEKQREHTELLTFTEEENSAALFLARVKASKKLDKDLGKNHLYNNKYGTMQVISKTRIITKTTQKDETLAVGTKGGFTHFKTSKGGYKEIGESLNRLIVGKEEKAINGPDVSVIHKDKLKNFIQSLFKGKTDNTIVKLATLQNDLIDSLKADVELIFGIEVKRNSAVLLTNAMFFDLVHAEQYAIKQMAQKIPMAMDDAVSGSTIIDNDMQKLSYDYRNIMINDTAAQHLLQKDCNILQDWLKLKCDFSKKIKQLDVHDIIPQLGIHDIVDKLNNLKLANQLDCINTDRCNKDDKIHGQVMDFVFKSFKGTCVFNWANNKYNITVKQIYAVSAKVFYDLILEWYGIELSCLNKDDFISLKAAAEPQNPTLGRDDQGNSTLSKDKNEVSKVIKTMSKIKLSEPGQKSMIDYNKLSIELDKIDNSTVVNKIGVVHKKISSVTDNTPAQLIKDISGIFTTNKNKSSDEIMSCLKAIRLGLQSSRNGHLFNEILDNINLSAQDNGRADILTTLQKYYSNLEEHVSAIGCDAACDL